MRKILLTDPNDLLFSMKVFFYLNLAYCLVPNQIAADHLLGQCLTNFLLNVWDLFNLLFETFFQSSGLLKPLHDWLPDSRQVSLYPGSLYMYGSQATTHEKSANYPLYFRPSHNRNTWDRVVSVRQKFSVCVMSSFLLSITHDSIIHIEKPLVPWIRRVCYRR